MKIEWTDELVEELNPYEFVDEGVVLHDLSAGFLFVRALGTRGDAYEVSIDLPRLIAHYKACGSNHERFDRIVELLEQLYELQKNDRDRLLWQGFTCAGLRKFAKQLLIMTDIDAPIAARKE